MKRTKETGLSLTLQQLIDLQGVMQSVCRRCKHQRLLYPADFVERFGADTHTVELQDKMRCSKCGSLGAKIYDSTR